MRGCWEHNPRARYNACYVKTKIVTKSSTHKIDMYPCEKPKYASINTTSGSTIPLKYQNNSP